MTSSVQRRIMIATLGPGSLGGLASAMATAGHSVTVLADSPAHDQVAAPAIQRFSWNPVTRASTQHDVGAAIAAAGEPHLLVVRVLPAAASWGREVVQHDDVQWRESCGGTMLQSRVERMTECRKHIASQCVLHRFRRLPEQGSIQIIDNGGDHVEASLREGS